MENTKFAQQSVDISHKNVKGKFQFASRYPNYLKSSSQLTVSHFCLNKDNKKNSDTVFEDDVSHNKNKNLLLPKADSDGTPDIDDNKLHRSIYPNYLKASSKLVKKRFGVARNSDRNNVIKDSPEKTTEIQTSKRCESINAISRNRNADFIKYAYDQKKSSHFKENRSCLTTATELGKTKSRMKNADYEISMNDHIKDVCSENSEIERIKRENEDLKNKLKSTEVSLQESVGKCIEAQEEIKRLKCDIECQEKTNTFQKNHLNTPKMNHGNNYKKNNYLHNQKSKQKRICETSKGTLLEHRNNDTNISNRKNDLEMTKNTISEMRIHELQEQNRLMIDGLIELRDVLKTLSESQSRELKHLNFDSYDRFPSRNVRHQTFSESFGPPLVRNSKTFTTEKSDAELKEYLEMLQEMTEFSKVLNKSRKDANKREPKNLAEESSEDASIYPKSYAIDTNRPIVQSTQNFLIESAFDANAENCAYRSTTEVDPGEFENYSTSKKNNFQNNYLTEISQKTQHSPHIKAKEKRKIKKSHVGNGRLLKSTDSVNNLSHQTPRKHLIYNQDIPSPNDILKELDVFRTNDSKFDEHSSSRKSNVLPVFPMKLQCSSKDLTTKSTGGNRITFPK